MSKATTTWKPKKGYGDVRPTDAGESLLDEDGTAILDEDGTSILLEDSVVTGKKSTTWSEEAAS